MFFARLTQTSRAALGVLRRWLRPIDVPDHPHMPEAETRVLKSHLSGARLFLEYGAGGSTLTAARLARRVVSVDSDARLLELVRRRVAPCPASFVPLHVDIGLTEEYGAPAVKTLTADRIRRWSAYPKAPWDCFFREREEPDLILIDGRFRVACVLECLLRLGSGSRAVLLLDDYSDREHYRAIEPFIGDMRLFGRLLVFRKAIDFDSEACQTAQLPYFADWR